MVELVDVAPIEDEVVPDALADEGCVDDVEGPV
jgi:hypothetical protein